MKRWLQNLALALASLLLVGGCVEGGLRLAGLQPESEERWKFSWVEHDELWRMPPENRSRTARGGHLVATNSHGFRDRAFLPAEPGVFRILFLGDSVTFGHAVPAEVRFTERLEALLRARGHRVRVLNAGVPGWSTRQEWLFYRDSGAELAPDLVLVGFVLNDVVEMQRGTLELSLEQSFALVRLLDWLSRQSAAVAVLKRAYAAHVRPWDREVERVSALADDADAEHVRRAMERTAAELGRIAALARERGDAFGLVLFPFRFQVRLDDRDVPQRRLIEFARERGIPVLDTLLPLKRHPHGELFLDYDHFTPFGHEVVTEPIADWLEREGLLPAAAQAGAAQRGASPPAR